MPETSTTQTDPLDLIVAALTNDGPRTAGQLATDIGVAYSTLTPRLRQLESHGRVERVKDPTTKQTMWQAASGQPTEPAHTGIARSTPSEPAADADVDTAQDPADSDPAPGTGGAVITDTTSDSPKVADDATSSDTGTSATEATAPSTPPDAATQARKPKGTIAAAILEITRAQPDVVFKVSQLSKALAGTSAGAIANAAAKLVVAGELTLVCEKPASYQAA